MTKLERRIHKYLTKWQRKLRLNDWRIKLIVVEKNTPNSIRDLRGAVGGTLINPTLKSARIQIMEPEDAMMDGELEATVIHELIHLHMDPYPWGENSTRDVIMEQAVDALAIAFLKLDNPKWVDPRHNV